MMLAMLHIPFLALTLIDDELKKFWYLKCHWAGVWPQRKRLHVDKSIFFSFEVLMGGNEVLPYTQRSFSSRKNVLGCVHMHFLIGCLLALIFSMQKGKKRLASCGC